MIDFGSLYNRKEEVDIIEYESRCPSVFRYNYTVYYPNRKGRRVSQERTCNLLTYTIEDGRKMLFDSVGGHEIDIHGEERLCRVDSISGDIQQIVLNENKVEPIVKRSIPKLSRVEEPPMSISLQKSKVNTTRTRVDIKKDKPTKG